MSEADEVLLIPDTHASQISDSQLELQGDEVLVYFKFVTMTNTPIKRVNHNVSELVAGCPGYFAMNKVDKLRAYFHGVLDQLLDGAIKNG